jgi:hypothetical protein
MDVSDHHHIGVSLDQGTKLHLSHMRWFDHDSRESIRGLTVAFADWGVRRYSTEKLQCGVKIKRSQNQFLGVGSLSLLAHCRRFREICCLHFHTSIPTIAASCLSHNLVASYQITRCHTQNISDFMITRE